MKDFDPDFDATQIIRQWEKLKPGRTATEERSHVRKDGTSFPVEVRLGAIDSSSGRMYLAMVRDITDRKRAEEALALAAGVEQISW